MRRWIVVFVLLGLLPLLAAEEAWKTKPPAQWTSEDAIAVLEDSPWGQRVTLMQFSGRMLAVFQVGVREYKVVYQEGPTSPPRIFSEQPARIEPEMVRAVYAVRWDSAKIVQQALARLGETSPTLREMQAPPSELADAYYVITARVVEPPTESALAALDRPPFLRDAETGQPLYDRPPVVSDIFAGLSEEELKARAELRTAGKLRLEAERVVRHGLGASEGISFYFPRQQNGRATLPPQTQWAQFTFEGEKRDQLKLRFKLSEMQVKGQVDY